MSEDDISDQTKDEVVEMMQDIVPHLEKMQADGIAISLLRKDGEYLNFSTFISHDGPPTIKYMFILKKALIEFLKTIEEDIKIEECKLRNGNIEGRA